MKDLERTINRRFKIPKVHDPVDGKFRDDDLDDDLFEDDSPSDEHDLNDLNESDT
jgi:hypothetical protein